MDITVDKFIAGPLETNCYVVGGMGNSVLVFDPSGAPTEVLKYLSENKLNITAVVLTHGHFDHIMGLDSIVSFAGGNVNVRCHKDDIPFVADYRLNGSEMIGSRYAYAGLVQPISENDTEIGGYAARVLHVPGHSPGGCAFVFGCHCIVGDVLFAGSIGRSDLPGGDGELLIAGIKSKLFSLPEDTICYPGHGRSTTIAREKRYNPFLS